MAVGLSFSSSSGHLVNLFLGCTSGVDFWFKSGHRLNRGPVLALLIIPLLFDTFPDRHKILKIAENRGSAQVSNPGPQDCR